MNNQPTIYDISKKAGVSIATVSRVLNGSDNVREKTRQKILNVMEECGYKPNAFARGLGLNSMKTVGIMCADSSDLYLAKAVYYIERSLRENGYNSVLCCTGFEHQTRMESLELLLSQHVDSIILVGSNYVREKSSENRYIIEGSERVPIMILNGYLKADNIYCIICDDEKAIRDTTLSLIDSGSKSILYLHSGNTYSEKKKLSGFRKAFRKRHIELNSDRIRCFTGSHEDIEGVKDYLQSIKKEGTEYDSIVCSQDFLAVGAMKYAHYNGINVPNELQIVGYNDSILAQSTEPSLTSVNNRLEDMCSELVRTFINVLSEKSPEQLTKFNASVICRGSTKKL